MSIASSETVSIQKRTDAGHQNLLWQAPNKHENLLNIDISKIIESPACKDIVRSLPSQVLYHGLKIQGIEHAAEVLAVMSQEQMTRFLDYEVWSDDQLDSEKAFHWLLALGRHSKSDLAKQFRDLEEEYQISLLQKHLEVYLAQDDDDIPETVRDEFARLPDSLIYYRFKTENEDTAEFLNLLIQSLLENDIRYAHSVILHAGYMPPTESEGLLHQFRTARLEEDGYVTYSESLEAFVPIALDSLNLNNETSTTSNKIITVGEDECFLDALIRSEAATGNWSQEQGFAYQQQLLFLANSLCTACHLEPSNISGLNRVLEQMRHLISIGLEVLSRGDLAIAKKALEKESAKTLFRIGLGVIHEVQESIIQDLIAKSRIPEVILGLFKQKKWARIHDSLDDLIEDLELSQIEILKGLLNRFPMKMSQHTEQGRIRFAPFKSISELKAYAVSLNELFSNNSQFN